jgi:branched-chain amino acid transport system permease protein
MADLRHPWIAAAAAIAFAVAYVNIGGVSWTSFGQLLVTGLVFGSIYGLVALAYNIVFATRNIINFAQGEIVVVGMLVGWSLTTAAAMPWPIALVLACAASAAVAMLVEPIAVRPVGNVRTNLAWIMSTFGFGIALKEVLTLIWGKEPLAFPRFIGSAQAIEVWGIRILPQELAVIAVATGLTALYQAFTRRSIWGAAIRAVAQDQRTATLMGIDAQRVVLLAYGLSGAVGGLAGFFIAPITFADPQFGIVVAISGFIAAVIGGLGRVTAGFLGGIFLGLLENLATGIFAVQWKEVVVFAALLLVMAVRPQGLFAPAGAR